MNKLVIISLIFVSCSSKSTMDRSIESTEKDIDALQKMENGNYQGAKEDLETSISINPNNASAYNAKGLVNSEMKNWNEAIQDFSKSIQLDPNQNPIIYMSRGLAKYEVNDFDGACEDFQTAKIRGDARAQKVIDKFCN
jgi:tetratricopeptide (TPR) repeat protein